MDEPSEEASVGRVPHPLVSKGAEFDLEVASMESKRNPLVRLYGRNDLHFVTFSCHRRRPFLGTARARNQFLKILDEIRERHAFELVGYVVMPEHVHMLIGEPLRGNPSKVMQVLKQRVTQSMHKRRDGAAEQMGHSSWEKEQGSGAFWQRRFYDFNVWSEKKLREKLNYMHRNPVDRKLVLHPKDWPWSSWSFYEKGEVGLIRIDVLKPRPRGGLGQKESQNPHP